MRENNFGNIPAPVKRIAQAPRPIILPDKRQQDKIIAILDSKNFDLLSKTQLAVSGEQRDMILKKISSGEIGGPQFKELFLNLKSPVDYERDEDNPVLLYSKVSDDRQIKGFIAEFAAGGIASRDSVTVSDLGVFLKKYPDPLTLEKAAQVLLDKIEELNSPQKRQEYESSLKKFMAIVYGKRQEYYNQIKLLLKEAKNRNEPDKFQVEAVGSAEAEAILKKTEIHGSNFAGEPLTVEILKDEGLMPKHKIRVGDSVVWLSSSGYELDSEGRIAVVAYVEKEGKIIARSYYRSNSQGIWRYLPDYTTDEENKNVRWYGKGHSEESVTLPIAAQKALSQITAEGQPILKLKRDPFIVFAGTARKLWESPDTSYYREVESAPRKLQGGFYASNELEKTPPEEIRLIEAESPDFSHLLMSWEQGTSLYGKISVEVFPSKDGKLKFMFCKDSAGRVWIGGIENDSRTQSTGLKKSWVKGGDLATPAFEYDSQAGGYGNDKMSRGHYVDMYENYLKRIPVIQEYLMADLARHYE